jgi:hypothetical protein
MDDGKSNDPGEVRATAIDTVGLDTIRPVLAAMARSWAREMDSRLYFPLYGKADDERSASELLALDLDDSEDAKPAWEQIQDAFSDDVSVADWHWYPNREAIDELPSYESLTLFEVAVLIGDRILGDRILGGPWKLIGKAPELFATELLRGAIDPRHPLSGLRYSDNRGEVPDMRWRLPREEIQAFAMLRWDREVYTDAELRGGAADVTQAQEETFLRIIGALVHALADIAPADVNPPLKKSGKPYPGTARDTGNTGIVGYLKERRYTDLGRSTLEKHIGAALKISRREK